jgi:hypothetical protein
MNALRPVVLLPVLLLFTGCPNNNMTPPPCSAATCSGCCGSTGKCETGVENAACGKGGVSCIACSTPATCNAMVGMCLSGGTGGGNGGVGGGSSGVGGGSSGVGGGSSGVGGGSSGVGGGSSGVGGGSSGVGGGSSGVGGGSSAGDVTGHVIVTHRLDDGGTTLRPINLTASQVGAWIGAGGASPMYISGTGTASGTFTIPGVPAGEYMFRINNTFFVTQVRALDLDYPTTGRPDGVPATIDPTTVTLDFTNLDTWQMSDQIDLVSTNGGVEIPNIEYYGMNPPQLGATTLTGLSLNYYLFSQAPSYRTPMIDATQGDRALVLQRRFNSDGGTGDTFIVRSATPAPFTMSDGQTSSVTGAFVSPPQQTVTFDVRQADFAALGPQLNPPVQSVMFVAFYGGPVNPATLDADIFAELGYQYAVPPSTVGPSFTFGNPFPSGWGTSAIVLYQAAVQRTLPGASVPLSQSSYVRSHLPLAAFTSGPVQPQLGPVGTPRVNGLDLFADQVGVGTAPNFSWTAPTLGTPSRYRVTVSRLAMQQGQVYVAAQQRYETTGTSLALPPASLVAGQAYVVTLGAFSSAGVSPARLFGTPLPLHDSAIVSGVIRP